MRITASADRLCASRSRLRYVFRHFEDCEISCMRWQARREVCDVVTLPDGSGLMVERFELLAWAESAER